MPDQLVEGDERITVQLIGGVDYDVFRDGLTNLWIVDNDRWQWQSPTEANGESLSTNGWVEATQIDPSVGDWYQTGFDPYSMDWTGDSLFNAWHRFQVKDNSLSAKVFATWEYGDFWLWYFGKKIGQQLDLSFSYDPLSGNVTVDSGSGIGSFNNLPSSVNAASTNIGYSYEINNSDPYTKTVVVTLDLLAQVAGTVTTKVTGSVNAKGQVGGGEAGGGVSVEHAVTGADGGRNINEQRRIALTLKSVEE